MISNPAAWELILPTVRTRQCRFPTHDYFGVGKRHCRVLRCDGEQLFWGRETALPCPTLLLFRCSRNGYYFSLGNDAMPTNSIARPPPRIANASKPTAKSNPDVFSIKLNRSPAVRRVLRTLHINVKKWFEALVIAVGYLGCTLRIDALLISPILCQWRRSILANRGRCCCGIWQPLHLVC